MLQLLTLHWPLFCLYSLHKIIFCFYWVWLYYLLYKISRMPHRGLVVWGVKLVIYILFVVLICFWFCFLSYNVCLTSFRFEICKKWHTFCLQFIWSMCLKFQILTRSSLILGCLLNLRFLWNLLCYKKINLLFMRGIAL